MTLLASVDSAQEGLCPLAVSRPPPPPRGRDNGAARRSGVRRRRPGEARARGGADRLELAERDTPTAGIAQLEAECAGAQALSAGARAQVQHTLAQRSFVNGRI